MNRALGPTRWRLSVLTHVLRIAEPIDIVLQLGSLSKSRFPEIRMTPRSKKVVDQVRTALPGDKTMTLRDTRDRRPSAQRLRHTFASQMLASGMPVTSLQRYLGHEHLDTTMLYAEVSDPLLQQDYCRETGHQSSLCA